MRYFLVLFLLCTFLYKSWGQLPPGSPAPNIAVTDLNGNGFNLYSHTANNKGVVIDFFATWCGPCWSFHNSGILASVNSNLGAIAAVVGLEADFRTNTQCMYGPSGCNYSTLGNWVTVPYQQANLSSTNGPGVASSYAIGYYPTLYVVSHDNRAFEVRNKSYSVLRSWLQESFFLKVNPLITDAACGADGAIDLNRTKGYGAIKYYWSSGETTEDLVNVSAGSYTVTVEDQNGYDKVFGPFVVHGPSEDLAVDIIDSEEPSCYGGNDGFLVADATGGNSGYTYLWSNGSSSYEATDLTRGRYFVTVTDARGCQSVNSYILGEPALLQALSSVVGEECGQSNGKISMSVSGGVRPYTYDLGRGTNYTGVFDRLKSGIYFVTVTDAHGCETEHTAQVGLIDGPMAYAGPDLSMDCSVSVLTIHGSGDSGGDISYLWTTGDGEIVGNKDNLDVVVGRPGVYYLHVTNAITECTTTDTVEVTDLRNYPNVTIDPVDPINCYVTEQWIYCEYEAGVAYEWETREGNILTPQDSSTIAVNVGGWYFVWAQDTISHCESVDSIWIAEDTQGPEYMVLDSVLQVCPGDEITLAVLDQDTSKELTYIWSTIDGEIVGSDSNTLVTVLKPGEYTVEVTDEENGCVVVDTVLVLADWNLAEAQFDYTASHLDVAFFDVSSGENLTWFWDFGDRTTSIQQNPTHEYDTAGVYRVCLTVTTECGSDTTCTDLEVDLATSASNLDVIPWEIYPNPGFGQFCIKGDSKEIVRLVLTSIEGQTYPVIPNQGCVQTDVLPRGLYFVRGWNIKGDRYRGLWMKM